MSTNGGPPRTAIIGTGRSGTGYMARLVMETTHSHYANCGHEGWWRAIGQRVPGLYCDASWLALPDIEAGAWAGPTVHVVRDPVATVRSLIRTEFFGAIVDTEYPSFALKHSPAAADALATLGPVAAAIEFWADWNARCAAVAHLTVRIEDVADWDGGPDSVAAATCSFIADTLDIEFGAWQLAAAIPTNVNTRPHPSGRADLPFEVDEGYVWDRLGERALAFGYAAP